jgi:hypothetical protein
MFIHKLEPKIDRYSRKPTSKHIIMKKYELLYFNFPIQAYFLEHYYHKFGSIWRIIQDSMLANIIA